MTTDWMHDAACRRRPDLDWFDTSCSLQAILEICVTCPVGDQCLNYAITIEAEDGVWGGEWGYRLQNYVRQGRRGGRGG